MHTEVQIIYLQSHHQKIKISVVVKQHFTASVFPQPHFLRGSHCANVEIVKQQIIRFLIQLLLINVNYFLLF